MSSGLPCLCSVDCRTLSFPVLLLDLFDSHSTVFFLFELLAVFPNVVFSWVNSVIFQTCSSIGKEYPSPSWVSCCCFCQSQLYSYCNLPLLVSGGLCMPSYTVLRNWFWLPFHVGTLWIARVIFTKMLTLPSTECLIVVIRLLFLILLSL